MESHNYQDKKSRQFLLRNRKSQLKPSQEESGSQLCLRKKSGAAMWGIKERGVVAERERR